MTQVERKKTVLNKKNLAKIDETIKAVEGRSSARTVTAEKILEEVIRVEKEIHVPKKALVGLEIILDLNAQDFPRAYKYVPMSTQVRLIRTASSWTITSIWRDRTQGGGRRVVFLTVPQITRDAVLARVFGVVVPKE